MGKFTPQNQPSKRRGKGFKTIVLESLQKEAENSDTRPDGFEDCRPETKPDEVETMMVSHIVRRAFNPKGQGSDALLKSVLDRCWQPLKATLPTVEFEFDASLPPNQQVSQILQAAADGIIPPEIASTFIQTVKSVMEIEEFTELRERIEELERITDERDS